MVAPGSPFLLSRARHWVYLDDARTHEVHAQAEPRASEFVLSTTEFPAGSRDPAEALVDERRLGSSEKLRVALLDLEQRLAVSGTYYRADVEDMRWSPLQALAGARKVDLRAHEVALPGATLPGAKMAFHHFHSSSNDSLLITVPRTDLGAQRSILAQLDFDFPRVDAGDLKVLHTRLAAPTLKSAVVKQHFELPTRGFAKLIEPRDYEGAYGAGWVERTRDVFRKAAARVFTIHQPAAPPPPSVASEYPTVQPDRLALALQQPKVEALRARYLAAPQIEMLFNGGELAIRRFVQTQRKRADHHTIYDLAVLEAALLVEYGLRKHEQTLLMEEGSKLLRYALPTKG